MTRTAWLAGLTGAIVAAGVAGFAFHQHKRSVDFADADDAGLVARGRAVYAEHCASCHGAALQGQPHWQRLNEQGRLPAPPQDQTGHSWMHADAELFRLVRNSVADVAPPGYQSDMPAFKGVLPDSDITAVIAFIKSSWPVGVRVYQALQNPDSAGMPANAVGGDWRLPPDCGAEPARQ